MRDRNLLLGFLAFTIAVGSAFTNLNGYETAWVKVLFVGTEDYICVDTGLQCNEYGPMLCRVYVNTISGLVVVPARNAAVCTYTLSNDSNFPIGILYGPGAIQSAQ